MRRSAFGLRYLLILLGVATTAPDAAAQQIDPEDPPEDPALAPPWVEWSMGLRAVTSVGASTFEGQGTRTSFDFSDSLLYIRPRVPLLVSPDLRGGALLTLTFPDTYERPGSLFVGDAQATVENRWAFFRLGRGRLKSHVVPTPALRDDDLLRFAETQNPFSDGESTADHQYGNLADLTLWPTPRLYVDVHGENLSNAVLAPQSLAAFELNSVGLTVGYRQIPAMTTFSVLRGAGIGGNAYHVNLDEREWAYELLAGYWLNLVPDPVHTVDWRAQAIYALGVPGADPTTATGTFQARSLSTFSSVGYTWRRSLLPTFRANAGVGYRRYLDQGADQMSALGNVFWALGQTVEVGAQYQYRRSSGDLPQIFGEDQVHSVKLFLVGTFETVLNPIFDDRASLLNTESGYLP